MSVALRDICTKYVEWVSRNPQKTGDIETTLKWLSYFLAGRVSNSTVLSELVYSVFNLVVLFNDSIIRKTALLHTFNTADKLKTWLTVLEYSEVFIEVSAFQTWGATGRWTVIVLVQVFKCITRLALLHRFKENIVQNPPVVPLRRGEVNTPQVELPPEGFTLHSGRVIRTVEAAAPLSFRTWKPPALSKLEDAKEDVALTSSQMFGEVLYIVKPLTHLVTLYRFGPHSWRPWIIAFIMDLASLHLVRRRAPGSSVSRMSRRQRVEVSRRQVALLLYLLRSPFYETQTRDRLHSLLHSVSDTVPLVGNILRPLAGYIPHWQNTYFYMWST